MQPKTIAYIEREKTPQNVTPTPIGLDTEIDIEREIELQNTVITGHARVLIEVFLCSDHGGVCSAVNSMHHQVQFSAITVLEIVLEHTPTFFFPVCQNLDSISSEY